MLAQQGGNTLRQAEIGTFGTDFRKANYWSWKGVLYIPSPISNEFTQGKSNKNYR